MWFKESNRYFWKIEKFAYREINERSFSNPHPCSAPESMLTYCHLHAQEDIQSKNQVDNNLQNFSFKEMHLKMYAKW